MGLPFSPILAEIYRNDFENHVINSSKYKNNIILWARNVDDILTLWKETNRH